MRKQYVILAAIFTMSLCFTACKDDPIAVTELTLDKTTLTLFEGETETLTVAVLPDNTTNKKAHWYSSNTNVATVDKNGKITALAKGFTVITAICEEKSATCKVTVCLELDSGTTGDLSWIFADDGTLFIRGNGEMPDYEFDVELTAPWETYQNTIETLIIDSGVTNIGNFAFYECNILKNITIPNSLTSIGDNAFYSCTSLTDITLPNSLKNIGNSAFSYCSGFTSINIPNNVTRIGEWAFTFCSNLMSITIPKSVTSIGEGAFYYCIRLTSIAIPDGTLSIENWTFQQCSRLTNIIIPNSITSIGTEAFRNCNSLKSIIIPNSVTSIGAGAFYNCGSLVDINIPNGMTSIESSTFIYCGDLKGIIIPNSVASIGSSAFWGCRSLTEITVETKLPPDVYGSGCFYNVNRSIPVYVPQESLQAYKDAPVWKEFTNLQGKEF